MAKYVISALHPSLVDRSQSQRRKKVRNDVVQVFHGQGVFPFFNLSAEIRNMIYALLFVSEFYVGESANKNNQWVFVNFAREYRRVREFELSMVNKQFFQESTTVFFSRNGFELASFKSLDLFLSHIGPIASSSIRSLRIFPKLDDPTPALCHLVVATNLQHLDVEMNLRRVRTGAWKIKLENAMDIVFNQDDKVVFSFTRRGPLIPCSFLMLEPEPSMAEILNIRGILYSKLPGRFYYALTDFITKKKNGKYNAYASFPFPLATGDVH